LPWIGPKHSGKTAAAARLDRAARAYGFVVAGFLAPAVYDAAQLTGFELLDLQNGVRVPMAQRCPHEQPLATPFDLLPEGLRVGGDALDRVAQEPPDLVVVDKYDPLELAYQGRRHAVDDLVATASTPLLLVVRQALAYDVRQLYEDIPPVMLPADESQSIDKVIQVLHTIRTARRLRFRELRRTLSVPFEVDVNSSRQMEAIEREEP